MYELIDRPLVDLDRGARFLVWSMRSWVLVKGAGRCPADAIAPQFCARRMLSGLQPFLRLMALFNRYALENFQFCALPCDHISEHEAIILSLVRSLRDNHPLLVCDTLALLVEEDAVTDAVVAVAALGRAMDAAALAPPRAGLDLDTRAAGSGAAS